MIPLPPSSTLFPYTTLFRSNYMIRVDLVGVNLVFNATCNCNRSEEHTSELQSRPQLVCRLLLEKKKAAGRSGADTPAAAAETPSAGRSSPRPPGSGRLTLDL